MYMKICNRCNKKSFSSSECNSWECPSCLEDITEQKGFIAPSSVAERLYGKKKLTITITKRSIDRII